MSFDVCYVCHSPLSGGPNTPCMNTNCINGIRKAAAIAHVVGSRAPLSGQVSQAKGKDKKAVAKKRRAVKAARRKNRS